MFPIPTPSFPRKALKPLTLALLCVVFVALVLGFLNLRYTVNDNTGIVAFMIDGQPIPYVGILLSSLLHQAYVAAPRLPWFALTLYALQTFSMFLWLTLVWRVFSRRWLAVGFSMVVFGYYLGFIVSLDFTATSVMLCMAALAWACVQTSERCPGNLRILTPGLMFMLGMLVRPDGAFGALAYALPSFVIVGIICINGRAFLPEAKRLGVAGLLFILPAVLNMGVDAVWRDAVRTPQEAQYEAFNAEGGRLMHLNPGRLYAINQDPALLASVQWTPGDVTHFQRWQFLDERIYTPKAFRTLWVNAPPPILTYDYVSKYILQRFPPHTIALLLLVATVPLFLYLVSSFRGAGAIGLLFPIYCLSLTVFMYLMYAYGDRVEFPFETGAGFMALLMAGMLARHIGPAKGRGFLLAACVSLVIALTGMGLSMRDTLDGQQQLAVTATQIRHKVYGLNKYFAGSVILVGPSSLNLNELSPFEHVELHFHPIDLGWNTFSPRFYQQIGSLGIEHGYQLVDAMVDRPDTYVLAPRRWCESLVSYASDSDRRKIQVVMVGTELFRLGESKKK